MKKINDSKSTGSFLRTISTMLVLAIVLGAGAIVANAQAFTEGFDTIVSPTGATGSAPIPDWWGKNNSTTAGSTTWFQGNPTVFPSHTGATNSYIGANFNNTTGANTISNWLLTPNRTFNNGDQIKFYTRTVDANPYPDRMQIRLSTAGASTNVGTSDSSLGDFTTLLLDINPTYDTGGAYPETWTQFTLTLSGLSGPTSGRVGFRYFVELGGPTGDNSDYIGIDTFEYIPAAAPAGDAPVDFNGDGKTDYSVVRNVGGGPSGQVRWYWNINGSAAPTAAADWGLATDFFISGDYDGDGKDDIVVWRPGAATVATYYILNSATSTLRQEAFGQTGDDPTVVGDYNGDGKDDLAVYRAGATAGAQSTWYFRTVANGAVSFVPWGMNGDYPAPGDYDGNGKADFGIQRNAGGGQAGYWILSDANVAQPTVIFGTPTDVIVPGDYDGDGKTDIATARGVSGAIQWQWRNSSNGAINYRTFGASATDSPVQGDYDGDGKTDVAIWRPTAGANAFWSLGTTSNAVTTFAFGANGDYPVANSNSH